jgi:hypothetical protein
MIGFTGDGSAIRVGIVPGMSGGRQLLTDFPQTYCALSPAA